MSSKRDIESAPSSERRWFCLRAQPRHEHIAAAHLQQDDSLEVFLPRIKYRRATTRGPQWMTEALFPGYLFARFELQRSLRLVQYARGVRGIVHFGEGWPAVPDEVIAGLRQIVGEKELHILADDFTPGDEVSVAGGAFRGLQAVVTRYLPGRERVSVLLEFLGRQTSVELSKDSIVKQGDSRRVVLGE